MSPYFLWKRAKEACVSFGASPPPRRSSPQRTNFGGSNRAFWGHKMFEYPALLTKAEENDEERMLLAIDEAVQASLAGEVPVGAVLVHNGRIKGRLDGSIV